MNSNIEKLKYKMRERGLQGFIILKPENIRYLTDLDIEDATLIILENESILLTSGIYREEINQVLTIDDEIQVIMYQDITKENYYEFFNNCEKVGFEENYVTYEQYSNLLSKYRIREIRQTNNMIENLRKIKSREEIDFIEKACNITDNCFLHLQSFIKEGMTEKEIAMEIDNFFIKNGAEGNSFNTIVASGANSSKPHAKPTDKKVLRGDPILIDFGAKYKGYCADMTRTVFLGEVNDKYKELYNFVLDQQTSAFNKMKNNVNAKEIAQTLENAYRRRNFNLIHALGHGVGLEVHENPILSYNRDEILLENMVVTNEPGIYIEGEIGIRIEDTVLINIASARNLTKSNRNLLII